MNGDMGTPAAESAELQDVASELLEAFLNGGRCAPVSQRHVLDLEACYAVQREVVERRCAALGERLVGYKIGLTNQRPRERLGANEPVFGPLTSGSLLQAPAQLELAPLRQPRLEVELAFVVREEIPANASEQQILEHCDIALGFEINDSRLDFASRSADVTLTDLVCDQCLAAYVILGEPVVPAGREAVDRLEVELQHEGASAASGSAGVVMGSPLVAVSWLTSALEQHNRPLPVGSVIFSGNLLEAGLELQPGAYTARSTHPGLGAISCTIE